MLVCMAYASLVYVGVRGQSFSIPSIILDYNLGSWTCSLGVGNLCVTLSWASELVGLVVVYEAKC